MNKLYIIVFFSVISLSSCDLLKKPNIENSLLNDISYSEKELINKINARNISPEWTSLNSKIKINKEGQKTTINAQIRIKKDSAIWFSVKAPLGIEVFRTMITPDSIYYMSRMNKTYFIKHISHIKEVVKTDVSFIKIQEILFASPNITTLNSEKENYEILKDIFRIRKIDLQETEDRKASIIYSDYKDFSELVNAELDINGDPIESPGRLYFPKKIYIDIKSEEIFTAEINYTKIEFNKESTISFIIPKSYVPIN